MNALKTVLLLGLMSGVLLVGGEAIGGRQGLEWGLLIAIGMNFFSYFFSDKLALMSYSAQAASSLRASRLVTGVSARMSSEELAKRIGLAWERLPEPRHPFSLEIISGDRASMFVNLGPHPPRLWPEDVDLLHELWLELSENQELGARLHHRDVVGVALRRLQRELTEHKSQELIHEIRGELRHEDLPKADDDPAED